MTSNYETHDLFSRFPLLSTETKVVLINWNMLSELNKQYFISINSIPNKAKCLGKVKSFSLKWNMSLILPRTVCDTLKYLWKIDR